MSAYPTPSDIEIKWRASGSGVCVIVEGETEQEDPWFYNNWFGDRAREVLFFPQNGWTKVVLAVADLRQRLGVKRVYGIIDRDFEQPAAYPPLPPDGILRTPRYTLENYLLDPVCWASVFAFVFRRQMSASRGWHDPVQVQTYIDQCYRDCLTLAAHNRVIKIGCDLCLEQSARIPENERTYLEHPNALSARDPAVKHRTWGQQMNAPQDLGAVFTETLLQFEQADRAERERCVSGKYVLRELYRRFPLLPNTGRFALDHYVNLYLRECPEPPADPANLVELILQDAHS